MAGFQDIGVLCKSVFGLAPSLVSYATLMQVLDLALDEGDAVVGAALVGDAKSKQRLVILSKRKLIWYVLT